MKEQEFIKKATELVKTIVNNISDKKYKELASVAKIDESWVEEGQTQEQAFLSFGKWLDEQLAMWEEDEERKFVVDPFNKECLEEIEVEDDNRSFVAYNPTNSGEELGLWFEISLTVEENDRITATFNVNL